VDNLDLGLFFLLLATEVTQYTDDEEVEGVDFASLFGVGLTEALPFVAGLSWVPLAAPFEQGHWCCLVALQDMNLCPHAPHCCWGRPLTAFSACLQQSRLDVWFLFHASRFLSFWAAVA
jgi:hypothetical protein